MHMLLYYEAVLSIYYTSEPSFILPTDRFISVGTYAPQASKTYLGDLITAQFLDIRPQRRK